MTISYNAAMSSVSTFSFIKLMFRWRGSIWKAVLLELIVWLILYYVVFVIYRLVLSDDMRRSFEQLAEYMDKRLSYIPLTFMLGFFVSSVMGRWKNIFHSLGHIEDSALTLACLFTTDDPQYRLHRRSIIRYLVLSQILLLREISLRVKRRFPDTESLVQSGFLHAHEVEMLESCSTSETFGNYFVPVNWAITTLKELWRKNVFDALQLNFLFSEMRTFRAHLYDLAHHDETPVPLAYPQVVFLATRCFFLICLISRQPFIVTDNSQIDVVFPFMTLLQFIFFIGWMKVAEALLNPLGEDDDDFETNYLIDKNIAVGMAIIDETFNVRPDMKEDIFSSPEYAPLYSADSIAYNGKGYDLTGSAKTVILPTTGEKSKMIPVHRSADSTNASPNLRRRMGDAIRASFGRSNANSPTQPNQSIPTISVTRPSGDGNNPHVSSVRIQ